jgi:uncharacterized protein
VRLYLDSSALVKLYAEEPGSLDTVDLVHAAEIVATSSISRVEVASAIARGIRRGLLAAAGGRQAQNSFDEESDALVRVPVTDWVIKRARNLVWEFGLRGYDAVQLASALAWEERVGGGVTLATFDAQLSRAGAAAGLTVWPATSG